MQYTGQATLFSGDRTLLLSIKPAFAEMVLAGAKTVELRRVRPSITAGDSLLLYATSPQRQLVARGVVQDVVSGTVDEIWHRYGPQTGVDRDFFDNYFSGVTCAVAIVVEKVEALISPVDLDALRERWDSFHPPQSFRYLTGRDVERLLPTPRRRRRATTAAAVSDGG